MTRSTWRRIAVVLILGLVAVPLLPEGQTPAGADAPALAAEMRFEAGGAGPAPMAPVGAVEAQTGGRRNANDPQLPGFLQGRVDKGAYLRARSEAVGRLRGIAPGQPFDPSQRNRALDQMARAQRAATPRISTASWTAIGPTPIPNGQTDGVVTAVSGRVTAIAVHPTNPNTVYVGTAQGGLYRTLDGGTTWTALLDTATPGTTGGSLAIGAVSIAPSQPSTVFVGTGESNLSLDSFFGVGLYRITTADTSPTVAGPFATRVAGTGSPVGNGNALAGTAVSGIAVDPANANRVFLTTVPGRGGIGGVSGPAPLPTTGLYFTDTALGLTPTFSLVANTPSGAGTTWGTDVQFEPGSSNNLLVGIASNVAASHGIWRTINAGTASVGGNVSPAFMRMLATDVDVDSRLAVNKVGAVVTVFAATGEAGGTIHKSVDGGATWDPAGFPVNNGFCDPQCFFDLAIAVDPTNASTVHLGGPECPQCYLRSTDGGLLFSHPANTGLHADTHAIAVAPSNASIVYHGNDGGIYKSLNAGLTWTSLNSATFSATQFQSLATHPSDRQFLIGGTQDNGTNFLRPNGTWTRVDFGDGGFARIDQNAADTTNVTMYHTYFNTNMAPALIGFGRVTTVANAQDNGWTFLGCSGGVPANGIGCAENPLFYAPLELGPGSPNTVYFGTDRLHRSADTGTTNLVVSQVFAASISAIGISPQSDLVRLVGLANGQVFATTTGVNLLTDVTGPIPGAYIARAVIDPNNANTAYVTLNSYGLPTGEHVWKTTNLNGAPPAWAPAGGSGTNAIPDVPVNAFVVDPLNSQNLFAGTDIGVYRSTDGGATWTPFSAGLPSLAVFDMAFQAKGQVFSFPTGQVLRIATHGRGIFEITNQQGATPTPTVTATPTSTPTPTATPCIQGDINCDRIVDIRDYGIWRQQFGATDCGNRADLNGDCIVDIRDYGIWRANFGRMAGAALPVGVAPAPRRTPDPGLRVRDQAPERGGSVLPAEGTSPAVPVIPVVGGLLGLGGLAGWRRRWPPDSK
jgi:MYXO-CTERM domain-containing protein